MAEMKFIRCVLGWGRGHSRRFVRSLVGCFVLVPVIWSAEQPGGLSGQPLAPLSGPQGATLFTLMSPQASGVVTENKYADPKMWAERHHELELGAVGTGVAIGDYDGDGKPDLFVVSKTETCRLFRNLGDWKFEDVTVKAGVGDSGDDAAVWKQGATFVDVNNDGRLDIYLCRFAAPNRLYINQGDGTFKEEAAARGLAVEDASVMAAFCDYDRDGWLDVFVQTNLLDGVAHPKGQRDYLFHNNGDGTFANVTDRAGINGEGQGHSAIWWDYDNDGWPDLYVANDFAPADRLYHNNHDGTFTDRLDEAVPHTPFSSMGTDLGDVNNDGLIDLLVADMAATTHEKDQRTMAATRALAVDPTEAESRMAPQYLRNALYLGTGTSHCLEAAFLAGLAATDWTWSLRFEDLDNDGRLDLHVTNGMFRESHNTDLITRMTLAESQAEKMRIERSSPILAEANLAFRNLGDLRFESVGAAWGLDEKGVSFGAAFGDLDGDGDLDLVYTNYQKGVTLLRNDSATGQRLVVALRGRRSNRFGVGATVRVETRAGVQMRQLVLARGVLSSSEPVLHFGLGDETHVDRLTVTWPNGHVQSFSGVAAQQRLTITEPEWGDAGAADARPMPSPHFHDVTSLAGLELASHEAKTDELGQNPLLPMRQNRRGPTIAVGDINGDGLDDVVVAGTARDPLRRITARAEGFFEHEQPILPADGVVNDGPLLLFDADGNGTNDLLVTKAGAARPAGSPEYQPRLLLNDGQGNFHSAPDDVLPHLPMSVGAAVAADFDHSGRLGLFLGARVLPGSYPFPPSSVLLANRGGRFEDVTDTMAPGLRHVGLVTSALWSDVDDDGWPDLLVAVEWGAVRYFHNERGVRFQDLTGTSGFGAAGAGWWTSLAAADFNGDGRQDYVAGNLGLNTPYRADEAHPALLLAGDFNGDDGMQLVEAYFEGDRLYPWRTRKELGAVIPSILKRYARNDAYARATLGEILGEKKLATAERFAATQFQSGVFVSQPDGHYRFEPLPRLAQIAPLQGVVAGDFDGDGHADIYAVQNSYAPAPAVGRFDGGLSQMLRGDGHGHFTVEPLARSGLAVTGDAKALASVDFDRDGWADFIVTRNNERLLAFQNAPVIGRHSLRVSVKGPDGNPTAVGARLILTLADGTRETAEIAAGGGYGSQSGACACFGWIDGNSPRELSIRWPGGQETQHTVPSQGGTLTVRMNP